MEPRLNRQVTVKLEKPVFARLWAIAAQEGISVAEVVRQIVDEHFREESARMGTPVVEDAMRRVTEPHVDKLAGLITYAGLAAATSAWLGKALLNLLTDVDPNEVWDQAMARAKTSLRRTMEETEEVDDDQDQGATISEN